MRMIIVSFVFLSIFYSGVEDSVTAGKCEVCQRATSDTPLSQSDIDDGLFAACAVSCDLCAKAMLQAGARTEARDSEHYTPLMQASQRGGIKVLKLLLDWDCQVSKEEEEEIVVCIPATAERFTHRQVSFCVCSSFPTSLVSD